MTDVAQAYYTQKLIDAGVFFESRNAENHLVIRGPRCKVDYWPSTGRWIPRDGSEQGHGIFGLFRFLGIPTEALS